MAEWSQNCVDFMNGKKPSAFLWNKMFYGEILLKIIFKKPNIIQTVLYTIN